tara:strand:+ start:276 stop:593 length:318 start_codon:yes stop_codon:yes gene_type:complete
MYVVGVATTFNYLLSKTVDSYVDGNWDISIEDPTGLYTYIDNSLVGYVNPTSTTTGSLSYVFTGLVDGVHTIRVSRGTASSHKIIHRQMIVVVAPTPTTAISITL